MTTDEAEQLIAEIKELYFKHYTFSDEVHNYSLDVKKIIKRFANKPPYRLTIMFDDQLTFSANRGSQTMAIDYEDINGDIESHEMTFSVEQIKQLRDNCTKMLEYLDA